MTILTFLLFLTGNRQAIIDIATDRRAIWPALLFVLSAGLAREYDGVDLQREPWHLLIPFAAAIGSSFILFLIACGRFVFIKTENKPSFFTAYRSFLTLFLMTAPLAWLYAIPYERFLSEWASLTANLWTLALVAAWRVFIMVRVLSILTDLNWFKSLVYILGYAEVLILIAIYMMPKPLIAIMGGIRQSETDRAILSAMMMTGCFCLLTAPFLLLGGLYFWGLKNPTWQLFPLNVPHQTSIRGMWILAIASVLIWIPLLPGPQAEQRLKNRVEELMAGGQISEALDLMSAHPQSDFPPHWAPPPKLGTRERSPFFLDVMESLHARNDAEWVRDAYEKLFMRFIGYEYSLESDETLRNNLLRVFNLIEQSQYKNKIIQELKYDIQSISDSIGYSDTIRDKAKALLDVIKKQNTENDDP